MNETIKSIMGRRSTRGFKPEQIKREELEIIIECGLNAPSAMNSQGWYFTVVQDPQIISWMNEKIKPNLPQQSWDRMLARADGDENFSIFYGAPTIVLVSGIENDSFTGANCGLAAQNMCLAAHSIGVASCIIGLAQLMFTKDKEQEYMAKLKIPRGYKFQYAIAFGYPAVEMPKPERIPGKVYYIE